MSNIEGYLVISQDPQSKFSASALIMKCINKQKKGYLRQFGYAFGSCDLSYVRAKSVVVALKTIMPKYRKLQFNLFVDNDEIISLYHSQDEINKQLSDVVSEIKKMASFYSQFNMVKVDHLSQYYTKAKMLATTTCETQKHMDSGSKVYNE